LSTAQLIVDQVTLLAKESLRAESSLAESIVQATVIKSLQKLYRASMPEETLYDYRIDWSTPLYTARQHAYMLDTMSFRMGVVVNNTVQPIDPEDLECCLWTNVYHTGDNEGEWSNVKMDHKGVATKQDDGTVAYIYGVTLQFTCLGTYGFTFRVRHKQEPEFMTQNASEYWHTGSITIKQPIRDYTLWIQEPELSQITSTMYIGNHQAALQAPEQGFGVLLNAADDAPIFPLQMLTPIILRRFPLPSGADKIIPDRVVCESVNWLRAMSDKCQRILVHSRDGHGRAGSIVLAYIFAFNRSLTFEQALQFVMKRHFIYNHRGLRDTLYRLQFGTLAPDLAPDRKQLTSRYWSHFSVVVFFFTYLKMF